MIYDCKATQYLLKTSVILPFDIKRFIEILSSAKIPANLMYVNRNTCRFSM